MTYFYWCFLTPQNPLGSGLALAISHASHFLQPPPHQSIIIERMHSGKTRIHNNSFDVFSNKKWNIFQGVK